MVYQMNEAKLECFDCGVDVIHFSHFQYCMLKDSVWKQAAKKHYRKILCVSCIEKRLGRKLEFEDYEITPIQMLERMIKYLKG